jgi:hypothetical protein
MPADSGEYDLVNVLDPLGLLGHYSDRDQPIAYSEIDFVSPERERLRQEMAGLRGEVSPEQLQLHAALQEQYAKAAPAMRADPSLTRMQQGFEGVVPAQRRALRAGSAAMANRDAADSRILHNLLMQQEDRARQERLQAAARIRGAKTFDEDFKAMALAKGVQQAGVYGTQLAGHKPFWEWLDGGSESKPAQRSTPEPRQQQTWDSPRAGQFPADSGYYAGGGMEI